MDDTDPGRYGRTPVAHDGESFVSIAVYSYTDAGTCAGIIDARIDNPLAGFVPVS